VEAAGLHPLAELAVLQEQAPPLPQGVQPTREAAHHLIQLSRPPIQVVLRLSPTLPSPLKAHIRRLLTPTMERLNQPRCRPIGLLPFRGTLTTMGEATITPTDTITIRRSS
jgi:hypothetical protein